MIANEEEEWEARRRRENGEVEDVGTFEQYREKGKAAGVL